MNEPRRFRKKPQTPMEMTAHMIGPCSAGLFYMCSSHGSRYSYGQDCCDVFLSKAALLARWRDDLVPQKSSKSSISFITRVIDRVLQNKERTTP